MGFLPEPSLAIPWMDRTGRTWIEPSSANLTGHACRMN